MSHMDALASDSWVIRKKWPKRLFWALAAVTAIYLFPFSIVDEYTDRSRVAELIVLTAESRVKVESALLESTSHKVTLDAATLIPDALGVKSKEGEKIEIAYRDISEKGEVKVFAPQLGVLLIFTPTLADKKVSWSCWGRPLSKVPSLCRGNS
jgi:hypothetical protein